MIRTIQVSTIIEYFSKKEGKQSVSVNKTRFFPSLLLLKIIIKVGVNVMTADETLNLTFTENKV